MANARFLHNFDLILCEKGANNHKGRDPRFDVPDDDDVDAEGKHDVDFRIVTEEELMKVDLFGCPDVGKGVPTKIASILTGKAKNILIRGKVPLLVTLEAIEAKTGHIVRVALTYKNRMIGAEGYAQAAYPDTKGLMTVGIGFNMDKSGAKAEFDSILGTGGTTLFDDVKNGTKTLTDAQIDTLLAGPQTTYESDARALFSSFDTLTPERKAAVTELLANMGKGSVEKFKNMRAAIDSGDYEKAAYELLHNGKGGPSAYANDVKAGRANNVAAALRWRILGADAPIEAVPEPSMSADTASRIA